VIGAGSQWLPPDVELEAERNMGDLIPRFLERLRQGSNVVEEINANVAAPATLLFARHVEALLREFANMDRISWNDDEDEYWTVFNCNPDGVGKYVGVFVGWLMKRDVAIEKLWIAVGGEELFWDCDLWRQALQGEAAELLSRLRTLVGRASQKANEGILYSFDVVTRIDASQILAALSPSAWRISVGFHPARRRRRQARLGP
jgi:hypothetical protein